MYEKVNGKWVKKNKTPEQLTSGPVEIHNIPATATTDDWNAFIEECTVDGRVPRLDSSDPITRAGFINFLDQNDDYVNNTSFVHHVTYYLEDGTTEVEEMVGSLSDVIGRANKRDQIVTFTVA